jgi:hypothetical protein
MDRQASKALHCPVKKLDLQKQQMDPSWSAPQVQRVIRVMLGNQDLRGCKAFQASQDSLG